MSSVVVQLYPLLFVLPAHDLPYRSPEAHLGDKSLVATHFGQFIEVVLNLAEYQTHQLFLELEVEVNTKIKRLFYKLPYEEAIRLIKSDDIEAHKRKYLCEVWGLDYQKFNTKLKRVEV